MLSLHKQCEQHIGSEALGAKHWEQRIGSIGSEPLGTNHWGRSMWEETLGQLIGNKAWGANHWKQLVGSTALGANHWAEHWEQRIGSEALGSEAVGATRLEQLIRRIGRKVRTFRSAGSQ